MGKLNKLILSCEANLLDIFLYLGIIRTTALKKLTTISIKKVFDIHDEITNKKIGRGL